MKLRKGDRVTIRGIWHGVVTWADRKGERATIKLDGQRSLFRRAFLSDSRIVVE